MIRLVAFDLDGTLVDSHRDIADATNAVIADLGGTPLEMSVVTGFVGDGAAVLTNKPQQPIAPGRYQRVAPPRRVENPC